MANNKNSNQYSILFKVYFSFYSPPRPLFTTSSTPLTLLSIFKPPSNLHNYHQTSINSYNHHQNPPPQNPQRTNPPPQRVDSRYRLGERGLWTSSALKAFCGHLLHHLHHHHRLLHGQHLRRFRHRHLPEGGRTGVQEL